MNTYRGINGAILNDNRETVQVNPFQYPTIQAAVDNAPAGSVIDIIPGAHVGDVVISKALTLVCGAARGMCAIIGSLQVLADDVTLINVGVAGASDGDYALRVGSQTVSPDRFRAYGCKFEGPETNAAVILKGAGDALFEDCEFTWAGKGLTFDDNDDGFCTQIFVQRCRFHNLTTVCIGLETSGGVVNLNLLDSIFDNAEDGTAPTDYLKIDRAGDTGFISGCTFACATNDTAVLTIASGIKWVANRTEAGVSTARPS